MRVKLPKVEHRVYGHTFLDQVTLQVYFDADVSGGYDVLRRFFSENYGLDLDGDKFDLLRYKSLYISGDNDAISMKFTSSFIQIKLKQSHYESFVSSMMPLFVPVVGMLSTLSANVTRLSLNKVNSWTFERSSELPFRALLQEVFSDNLMKNVTTELTDREMILSSVMHCDEAPYAMVVSFGYLTAPNDELHGRVMLETEAVAIDRENLSVDSLTEIATEMNYDLYDLYHWAVTPKVIENMA